MVHPHICLPETSPEHVTHKTGNCSRYRAVCSRASQEDLTSTRLGLWLGGDGNTGINKLAQSTVSRAQAAPLPPAQSLQTSS
ncbi:hypothetical protein AAFF_G00284130 [Aldrovandia affinis]|uniref:Uncharacterized protein n=1 Tax=Aldrovandia affinis TaxID=143900 RepID=A0AAD7TBN2_9TELE|nr:hypothetical protein AAFF_G00284130 [Aldrovandia affinis]